MTHTQKEQIAYLRGQNKSYAAVADILHLSVNTVKSFCRRNVLLSDGGIGKNGCCDHCGKPLGAACPKLKRFCCNACRMAWWKAHPETLNRKAVYRFKCAACGMPFESYGNAKRKYCSRACYGKAKAVNRT